MGVSLGQECEDRCLGVFTVYLDQQVSLTQWVLLDVFRSYEDSLNLCFMMPGLQLKNRDFFTKMFPT